ncbi:putative Monocarboxylate transporter [Magnetospirillum gryphiswaldense MSR-1 v2]|uniref:Monocarboxylate transporter n=1 Tax=Magnetospirillum gryphiswaldense (strain DSM 6361 / JCM 21280 / NBRC 15271 / MSR-1) TaxID=431944 RepID=V6EXL0_MAGGM|nr:MFS transporter [Magnetospirillum gryphiswaldense]CDK98010.1 putative Monocarboxylate transporter [Magnetospirillum gryphiswaldense MSR-1 v2]
MTVTMSIPAYIPILAATTAAQSLVSLAMLSPAAVAPAIARDLQVSGAMIGWWISMAYGGAMITSLLGGNAVRRFGATRSTQIGLLLVCLGGGAMMAGTLPLALLAALLTGLGYGMTNPAASHLLARSTSPERRNLVFSIKQTGVPLGGTLAGLIAPRLTQAWGWPAAMASVALTCLGLALLLALARHSWDSDRDPKSRMTGNPFSGLVSIWRSPRLKALSLTGFAYAAVQLSVSTFAVTMLVTDLSWSLVDAGLLLSAVQVAGVVGRISIGSLADRFFGGTGTLIGLGLVTGILALLTGLLAPDWPAIMVFAILVPFGAAALGWNGVYLAELAQSSEPANIPRVTGASLFFTYGGVLVGPPAFAGLHTLVGSYTATYALTALPALAGALILMAARRRNS